MKFPQMPLGQRFLFQGDAYVKIGPLTARREGDGQTRLIPRSAVVSVLDAGGTEPPAPLAAIPGWLSRALDVYERTLYAALLPAGVESDPDLAERLRRALDGARDAFLAVAARRDASSGE